MYTALLAADGDLPAASALMAAIILVSVLLVVAAVAGTVLRIKIFINYWVTNRQSTEAGYTGETAAKKMLLELGYTDIEVKKAGFFRALIYGNHYNPKKKVIYLRASTFNRNNVTSVGLALQKVGLVIQDKKNGSVRARWRLQQFGLFGPIMFIPIVIVGVIADLVTVILTGGSFTGVGTLIASLFGLAYFIASFVLTIYTLKVEKRAGAEALEILEGYTFLTADEKVKVRKVFKTYLAAYICDFIISLLEMIRLVLRVLLQIVLSNKNN